MCKTKYTHSKFYPAALYILDFVKRKPAAGGKFWHFGPPKCRFLRANRTAGGENFENFWPKTQRTPPSLTTKSTRRGGFFTRITPDTMSCSAAGEKIMILPSTYGEIPFKMNHLYCFPQRKCRQNPGFQGREGSWRELAWFVGGINFQQKNTGGINNFW